MTHFSDSVVLKKAWALYKEHAGLLIGGLVLFVIPYGVFMGMVDQFNSDAIELIVSLLFVVFAILWQAGYTGVIIRLAEGKKQKFADLASFLDRTFAFTLVTILQTLVIIAGLLFFIIPGIIFAMMFSMAPFLVLDKKIGVIEAMKKSAEITKGNRFDLLGFTILTQIIGLLGILALVFGVFVTAPLVILATALVYLTLNGQKSA